MMDVTLITGNQNKADQVAKWLGRPIAHQKFELDELQSLDLETIVEHKARQAYQKLQKPVLVEDVSLVMHGMKRLPGPFIKWFLDQLGTVGLCRIADGLQTRGATVEIIYCMFDGNDLKKFKATVHGAIAHEPRGEFGFGFATIFMPDGQEKTYAEMDDDEVKPFNHRAQALKKVKEFLDAQ